MNSSVINVAVAADGNYIDGLAGTLIGVARHAPHTRIHALIMDCGIAPHDLASLDDCIRRNFPNLELAHLTVSPDQLAQFNPRARTNRLNNSAYARLLLAEMMPHWDRVIYLDCDLFVDADLTALFAIPLDGAPIGAACEAHLRTLGQNLPANLISPEQTSRPAFNSGVMVMDLQALRKSTLLADISARAADIQGRMQDQAMLNVALMGRWRKIPARWNRQRFVTENFSIYRDHANSVWHFIGKMKPWHYADRHARGLVADFLRNLREVGWQRRHEGRWRPLSPLWRDNAKSVQAAVCRLLKRG